jgi:hypothetical protein
MKKLLVLGLLATLATAAFAVNLTLTGPSGLVNVPTASVIAAGQLGAAADWINTSDATIPVRVAYGVAENWEVAADYSFNDAANMWAVSGKYLTPLNLYGFGIAAGALYGQNDATIETKTTEVYAVATRGIYEGQDWIPSVKATVGAMWEQMDNGATSDGIVGLLGVEAGFPLNLTLVADYATPAEGIAKSWAVGVRYPVMPALTAEAGWTNDKLFVGASYAFGATE